MPIAGYTGADWRSNEPQVTRSLERLRYKSSDPIQCIAGPDFVLGATSGSQLWQHKASGLVVAWSGTLFHQADTAEKLGCTREANAAEIAGQAFLQLGHDFPDRLWGEFSVALWDPRSKRMLLVRDGMARRPIFYAPLKDGYAIASEPRGLQGWLGIDGRICERTIAALFAMEPQPGATLYEGIRSFPGGHTLTLERNREPASALHWQPLQRSKLRLNDWRQYDEHLREAMVQAVAVRLPAEGLVAAQLSSGFDSSGVTALAAEALARQNRSLVCYTSVPVLSTNVREIMAGRFADEWPLAAKVAAMYPNIEHVAIPSNYGSLWDALDISSDLGSSPVGFIRNSRWFHGILSESRKRGMTSMFEGQAGNLTSSYDGSFGLYDLRRSRDWPGLASAARARRRHGMRWATMVRAAWMPSARTNARLQWLRRKPQPLLFDMTLMREDFYRDSGLPPRRHSQMGAAIDGDRTSGASWRLSILSGNDISMMHAVERRGYGLLREDPTADRKLIELVLSIPDEVFAPQGKPRELYREAFRNHLPPELLAEPHRGLQSSDFLDHFEADLPLIFEEMERLEASPTVGRYIDLPRMRTLLESFPALSAEGRARADRIFNYTFGGALAMGRFLRRLESGEVR